VNGQRIQDVPLSGRFGNQLFQLCAAIYLAEVRGGQVLLDARGSRPKNISLLASSGLVSHSELKLDFKQRLYLSGHPVGKFCDYYVAFQSYIRYRLERLGVPNKILNFHRRKIRFLSDENWQQLNYIEEKFFGYFQNGDLVEHVWKKMEERLYSSEILLHSQVPSPNEIVLHIRLTDYLLHQDIGSLTEKYYLKCLTNFKEYSCTVVTDDEEGFTVYFPNLARVSKVYEQTNDSNESFKYMCNADNLIIANSSFSYWAGIFSLMRNSSATVISPNRWREDGKSNCILHKKFLLEIRS
jgi:hypothetical protein